MPQAQSGRGGIGHTETQNLQANSTTPLYENPWVAQQQVHI